MKFYNCLFFNFRILIISVLSCGQDLKSFINAPKILRDDKNFNKDP